MAKIIRYGRLIGNVFVPGAKSSSSKRTGQNLTATTGCTGENILHSVRYGRLFVAPTCSAGATDIYADILLVPANLLQAKYVIRQEKLVLIWRSGYCLRSFVSRSVLFGNTLLEVL